MKFNLTLERPWKWHSLSLSTTHKWSIFQYQASHRSDGQSPQSIEDIRKIYKFNPFFVTPRPFFSPLLLRLVLKYTPPGNWSILSGSPHIYPEIHRTDRQMDPRRTFEKSSFAALASD